MILNRRKFVSNTIKLGALAAVPGIVFTSCGGAKDKMNKAAGDAKNAMSASAGDMFFKISLAEWSLHKAIFDKSLDHLDFAAKAKELGATGIEYVNAFFADKAEDSAYLNQMTQRAKDAGVEQLLIMIDREGNLGELDSKKRTEAVENHYKWVDAARYLKCHSIRVNAFGVGTAEEVGKAAAESLAKLSEYASKKSINVIVENHGGYSSDGKWLSGVMKKVNMPNCGTLPDFGNFCVKRENGEPWGSPCVEEYDRYLGVQEMMPFAKAVSAKSHDFNEAGDEIHTDFKKMMQIVKDHGYTGYVGIEYEGEKMSEIDGIVATRKLLEKVGKQLS